MTPKVSNVLAHTFFFENILLPCLENFSTKHIYQRLPSSSQNHWEGAAAISEMSRNTERLGGGGHSGAAPPRKFTFLLHFLSSFGTRIIQMSVNIISGTPIIHPLLAFSPLIISISLTFLSKKGFH